LRMNATTSVGREMVARLESKSVLRFARPSGFRPRKYFTAADTGRAFHCGQAEWNSATPRLILLRELHHECPSAIAGAAAAGNASQVYGIFVIHSQLFARPDLPPAAVKQVARGSLWLQVGLAAMVDILRATSPRSFRQLNSRVSN
jgi:hypothetical protein